MTRGRVYRTQWQGPGPQRPVCGVQVCKHVVSLKAMPGIPVQGSAPPHDHDKAGAWFESLSVETRSQNPAPHLLFHCQWPHVRRIHSAHLHLTCIHLCRLRPATAALAVHSEVWSLIENLPVIAVASTAVPDVRQDFGGIVN